MPNFGTFFCLSLIWWRWDKEIIDSTWHSVDPGEFIDMINQQISSRYYDLLFNKIDQLDEAEQ